MAGKKNFKNHLKALGSVVFYFGIVHFKYDHRTNVFQYTQFNKILSFVVVCGLTLFFGIVTLGQLAIFFSTALWFESTLGQMFVNNIIGLFFLHLSTFHYLSKYLFSKHTVLSIALEMLRMFNCIKKISTVTLQYDGSFTKFLYLKLLCVGYLVGKKLWIFLFVTTSSFKFRDFYGQIVCSSIDLGYVYSQLYLVCIYESMVKILRKSGWQGSKLRRTMLVKRFARLSTRIHRVKRLCDNLFMPLFGATFAGLLWDLIDASDIVTIEPVVIRPVLWSRKLLNLECVLNIVLLYRLSVMLVKVNAEFNWTVSLLIAEEGRLEDESLEREVDLIAIGSFIHRLTTWAYGVVKVNTRFLTKFILQVLVVDAIFRFHPAMKWEMETDESQEESVEDLQSSEEYDVSVGN